MHGHSCQRVYIQLHFSQLLLIRSDKCVKFALQLPSTKHSETIFSLKLAICITALVTKIVVNKTVFPVDSGLEYNVTTKHLKCLYHENSELASNLRYLFFKFVEPNMSNNDIDKKLNPRLTFKNQFFNKSVQLYLNIFEVIGQFGRKMLGLYKASVIVAP